MTADRKLIVSFHDLHPGSRAQCERFLAMMCELGVARTTLLVVPRWHGAAPCDEDLGFAAWLRERAAEGHEICLHAYVHEATEVTGNAVQRAMGKHYTAGEGEFYQIDEPEAERRLREGLRIVRDGCGVPVWGFTAPAWLQSNAARSALAQLGFHYSTRWGSVELLKTEPGRAQTASVGACLQAKTPPSAQPGPAEPVADRSYPPSGRPSRSGLRPDSFAQPRPDRLQAGSYTGQPTSAFRAVPAPVLVWSVRAAWRRWCSCRWVRLWGWWQRKAPVLRIAVHPVDFHHPAIEASLRAMIARHLRDRTAACYRDLLPADTPPLGGET